MTKPEQRSPRRTRRSRAGGAVLTGLTLGALACDVVDADLMAAARGAARQPLEVGPIQLVGGPDPDGRIDFPIGVDAEDPALSHDGRFVAFVSSRGLVDADTNDASDVYRFDRTTRTLDLVSVDEAGVAVGGGAPQISADGARVLFMTRAAVAANDANRLDDLYVRRFDGDGAPRTVFVSRRDDGGGGGNCTVFAGALSADGSAVVFSSCATDLIALPDTNARGELFHHAVDTDVLELITLKADGSGPSGLDSLSTDARRLQVALSHDGQRFVFESSRGDLVADDTNQRSDVFLFARGTPSTRTLLSARPDGAPGDGSSFAPRLSGDGRMVLFTSTATDLAEGGPASPDGSEEVLLVRAIEGAPQMRVVDGPRSRSEPLGTVNAVIADDGSLVVFQTTRALTDDDVDDIADIYVRRLDADPDAPPFCVSCDVEGEVFMGDEGAVRDPRRVFFRVEPLDADLFERTLDPLQPSRAVSIREVGDPLGRRRDVALSGNSGVVAFRSRATLVPVAGGYPGVDLLVGTFSETLELERLSIEVPSQTRAIQSGRFLGLSGSSRFVAFDTLAQLVEQDRNANFDVYLWDRTSNALELISAGPDGNAEGGRTPYVSDDGTVIAFQSTLGECRAWRRGASSVELLSVGHDPSISTCETHGISADGSVVLMSSSQALLPSDLNGTTDVYVRVRGAEPYTELISATAAGAAGNSFSRPTTSNLFLSRDGLVVAFESEASDLVADDLNNHADVFVRLRGPTPRTVLISRDATGAAAGGRLTSLAADEGRRVAFTSFSRLVSNDTNFFSDAYLWTRGADPPLRLLSAAPDGAAAGGTDARLSGDGATVAYLSGSHVFMRTDDDDAPTLVTVNAEGSAPCLSGTFAPAHSVELSRDGARLVLRSNCTDLVTSPSSTLFRDHLYVHVRGQPIQRVSVGLDGEANDGVSSFALASDGRAVFFVSEATNLVAGDHNRASDLFVADLLFNTPPIARSAQVNTDEDTAVTLTLSATDADGDALTYTIVEGPAHGTLTGTAPALTYTPDADFFGTDVLRFFASDDEDDSAIRTVDIAVRAQNDVPVAASQTLGAVVGIALSGAVLASDVDGDLLTYAVDRAPSRGTLSLEADGTFVYLPASAGDDSFTFIASDGVASSAPATIALSIIEVGIEGEGEEGESQEGEGQEGEGQEGEGEDGAPGGGCAGCAASGAAGSPLALGLALLRRRSRPPG